ncbi:hypothetical protein BDF19DRAFT_445717 [Syncephalis fuscata]|nr:hypothetical protein BDF19DRAFT_445717 [Syncephalis fuscata]
MVTTRKRQRESVCKDGDGDGDDSHTDKRYILDEGPSVRPQHTNNSTDIMESGLVENPAEQNETSEATTEDVMEDVSDLYLSDVHLAPENGSVDGKWRWWILTTKELKDSNNNENKNDSMDGNENNTIQWTGTTQSIAPSKQDISEQESISDANRPIVLRFRFGTDLETLVREQVWAGALLLADYLVEYHTALFTKESKATVLELGAGTGLCSILLHRLGVDRVFCTDANPQVLRNCQYNIEYNCSTNGDSNGVVVRNLDWLQAPDWLTNSETKPLNDPEMRDFEWTEQDIACVTSATQVFVAADVIYDDTATAAFLDIASQLLRPSLLFKSSDRVLYVASEKRINFSLDELRVTAVAHDHFFRELRKYPCLQVDTDIDIEAIPQRFSYTRSDNLVLWKITWNDK